MSAFVTVDGSSPIEHEAKEKALLEVRIIELEKEITYLQNKTDTHREVLNWLVDNHPSCTTYAEIVG